MTNMNSIYILGLSNCEPPEPKGKVSSDLCARALQGIQDRLAGNVYHFDIHQPAWRISGDTRSFNLSDFEAKPAMTSSPVNTPSPAKLRAEQLAKDRCQTIAKMLWKENPNLTIGALTRHPMIRDKDLGGAQFYEARTVYDWIAEIKNHPQKNKRGRPRKSLK